MTGGDIRIGVSGWRYPPWRGVFYPKGLPQRQELRFIGETFRAAEINGTFYSLQRPEYFARWAAEVPDDFLFAVKGSRFITHAKKLKDVEAPLANFLAQGVLALGRKLGPFLWQFSAAFRFDAERMESFLSLLPRDTEAAARLARRHDSRVAGRALLKPAADMPLRHAVEVRHPSFFTPEFIRLLARQEVALVATDGAGWPLFTDVTADFVYCRLHGATELYSSGYDEEEIGRWAGWVRAWARGDMPGGAPLIAQDRRPRRKRRDVFVFFDNDAKVRAPIDATALIRRLGPAARA
jgi:uncharacterized protein YecE (DUF72 family)